MIAGGTDAASNAAASAPDAKLEQSFGLFQATALNVTTVVGAGVFITIPLMLRELPGPWALLGWLAAGALILVDSLLWSELGATFPGSGGSYLYLLECYGPKSAGRLMAFLFIWQFLISGPLEAGSGLIALAQFSLALSPDFSKYNGEHTLRYGFFELGDGQLAIVISPSRAIAFAIGGLLVFLLYRRITILGKLTVTFWIGVVGALATILVVGWIHFDPAIAFDWSGSAAERPDEFPRRLGDTMLLAIYSYLGYYNVCYIGAEVRDPGRNIPRAILLSAFLIIVLFVGAHLAMLGTISWRDIPVEPSAIEQYNLPAAFLDKTVGAWTSPLIALALMWSCIGSVFGLLLGYSRIPYGAAERGHFFAIFSRLHKTHAMPHVSLLFVGALTLLWSFFDLGAVITAMVTTRILEQFVGQVIGVVLLRRSQPDRKRPFRIWLYPVPCGLALAGWLYVYCSAEWIFILLGAGTLAIGVVVYFTWAWATQQWPWRPVDRV